MSTQVTYRGTQYNVPSYQDTGYAQGAGNLQSYLIALATGNVTIDGNQSISGTKTFTGIISAANGSNSAPSLNFGDTTTGLYRSSANCLGITLNGTTRITIGDSSAFTFYLPLLPDLTVSLRDIGSASQMWQNIYAKGIVGTTTNNNAAAGNVGEQVASAVGATNFPSNNNWGDLTNIALTAGDWDVSFVAGAALNGATMTAWKIGISATSGNNSSGLGSGDNSVNQNIPTSTVDASACIAVYRVTLAGSTTYYAKFFALYSAGQPQAYGRISARRVR